MRRRGNNSAGLLNFSHYGRRLWHGHLSSDTEDIMLAVALLSSYKSVYRDFIASLENDSTLNMMRFASYDTNYIVGGGGVVT